MDTSAWPSWNNSAGIRSKPRLPCMHAGIWKGCYPDFLVFGRKGSVIDPHLTSMEDAPFKAAALAHFADDHQDQFGRIDLIIVDKAGKPDEQVKRIRLMD